MEAYSGFAQVYDELMSDVPYEDWRDRICDAIASFGISRPVRDAADALESERNLVLDLGCGTGTMTRLLYEKGYDVFGVDASEEMLAAASEKSRAAGEEILYLCQDMRELDLYSTVGTVVSVCDSLNYLLDPADLRQTFSLVHKFLYPGGLFVFDCNTDHKYRDIIGESTIAQNYEDCSFIWENWYDEEARINCYDLTFYLQNPDGSYRRFEETHYQRGFEDTEIRSLLQDTGFSICAFLDSDTGEPPTPETQRLYVVARAEK